MRNGRYDLGQRNVMNHAHIQDPNWPCSKYSNLPHYNLYLYGPACVKDVFAVFTTALGISFRLITK